MYKRNYQLVGNLTVVLYDAYLSRQNGTTSLGFIAAMLKTEHQAEGIRKVMDLALTPQVMLLPWPSPFAGMHDPWVIN